MNTHFRTKLSSRAIDQIVEQADYYRLHSGSNLANRWRLAVRDTARSLRLMPERGVLCRFSTNKTGSLRSMPIDGFPQHSVFYQIDDEAAVVLVRYVLHAARDVEAFLSSYER